MESYAGLGRISFAQGLLLKGSAKSTDKRILLFTDEGDPFGRITGATEKGMIRTTLQCAKDAQDLGISIKLFPLSRQHEEVNISLFYAGQLHGLILLPMNLWRLKARTLNSPQMIKRISTGLLRLLVFKPLRCLKDYHNLRPFTLLFPSIGEIIGTTFTFIALHRSVLWLGRRRTRSTGSGQVELQECT
ncbi:hypothetical protein MKW98_025249 [Papaver atlanticum]|uniref:Ku70/Ku80 N-terminal alpha/beta domain-containing protein n=1 Tax=Papaver atlanticum TaxID=357466 RepID=A0AAD4X6D8_9MAGN|nr:hypothetical protein MKW98_025249 [Papaver atlanticum]